MKMLERAAQLTHIGSFTCYTSGRNEKSATYAKKAIDPFLLGRGYTIPHYLSLTCQYPPCFEVDFRNKFLEHIKKLIRREPRAKEANGKWTIFYK